MYKRQAQAREFHKATPLDSVIITKMDGSGKGGVAVAIMDEMHISPSFLEMCIRDSP